MTLQHIPKKVEVNSFIVFISKVASFFANEYNQREEEKKKIRKQTKPEQG